MPFITQGKANLKYLFIIAIVAAAAAAGILWYWQETLREAVRLGEFPEVSKPRVITDKTVNWKIYKSEKYGFEIKLPPEWHKTTVLQDWVLASEGYHIEGEVFTPLTIEEEQQRLKDLLAKMGYYEWGFEGIPGFCNLRYNEEKQFIIRPIYFKELNGRNFKEYIGNINRDEATRAIAGGRDVITDFQEIRHPTIGTIYQYHIGFGFEGCTDWGMRTYFPYPTPRTINGETVAGLLLEMEETSDRDFNTILYNQLISTFRFLE